MKLISNLHVVSFGDIIQPLLEQGESMAEVITLVDDVDQSTDNVTSHTFSFDGSSYRIDLSAKNLEKLNKALEPYITSARPAGSEGQPLLTRREPKSRKSSGAAASGVDLPALREWAAANKVDLPKRGRISKVIVDQYLASKAS